MLNHTRRLAFLSALLAAAPALSLHAEGEAGVLSLDQAIQNFGNPPVAAPEVRARRAIGAIDEADSFAVAGHMGSLRDWSEVQSQVAGLRRYFDSQDFGSALQQARQYARQSPTPEIRKRWDDLIVAMTAEQKRVDEAFVARVDEAIARGVSATLEARKAVQIDPVVEDLMVVQESLRNRSGPRVQRASNRLNGALGFFNQWQEMLYSIEAGETEAARQQFNNLNGRTGRDRPLTRAQILALGAALNFEFASIEQAMARLDPILRRAAEVALAAENAAALDPIMDELEAVQAEYSNSYESPLRRAHQRVSDARNFFRQWQDYLSARENGDERDARQQLRSLASNSYQFRPIPRSVINELGARWSERVAAGLRTEDEQLLEGVSWGDLAITRERFADRQEQAYSRRSTELSRIVAELDRLIAGRAALARGEAGAGRAALGSVPSGAPLPARLIALREGWWFDAMPALTGLADLPEREAGESAAAYVRRQFDAAAEASDWARAHRFAALEKDLYPSSTTSCGSREKIAGANPAAAIAAWLLGRKLEDATQTEAAAQAYRDAIAAGAPPKLETEIIQRLQSMALGRKTSA